MLTPLDIQTKTFKKSLNGCFYGIKGEKSIIIQ